MNFIIAVMDSKNKNNIQKIFNIRETVNIQSHEAKKIEDERQMEDNKARNDIDERIKPTEDKIGNIDNNLQDRKKTIIIFENRHVETVEKIKEVIGQTNIIQIQLKDKEQKMLEQNAMTLIGSRNR